MGDQALELSGCTPVSKSDVHAWPIQLDEGCSNKSLAARLHPKIGKSTRMQFGKLVTPVLICLRANNSLANVVKTQLLWGSVDWYIFDQTDTCMPFNSCHC